MFFATVGFFLWGESKKLETTTIFLSLEKKKELTSVKELVFFRGEEEK